MIPHRDPEPGQSSEPEPDQPRRRDESDDVELLTKLLPPVFEDPPTWYKDALHEGITYIVIVYCKAEGFVFCPQNLKQPFRVGGDYNGSFPCSAEGALHYRAVQFHEGFLEDVKWFDDYLLKVCMGEDFSLYDLGVRLNERRVIRGRWPW